jgi:hypothetical protein
LAGLSWVITFFSRWEDWLAFLGNQSCLICQGQYLELHQLLLHCSGALSQCLKHVLAASCNKACGGQPARNLALHILGRNKACVGRQPENWLFIL